MSEAVDEKLCEHLCDLARSAGVAILEIYRRSFEVREKADASPVTEADERAEHLILEGLRTFAPGVPVVAEESVAAGHVPDVGGRDFFLVDPLDGTREFIGRNGEFTVNIALVRDGTPVLGVVYAPALGQLFAGDGASRSAFVSEHGDPDAAGAVRAGARESIHVRPVPSAGITAVASRSHGSAQTEAYLARYTVAQRVSIGSSLKFCLVARGRADLYPRLGPTMEWDTAAGHAVLLGAGGSVVELDGRVLRYGKPQYRNPWFVASGPLVPLAA